MTMPSSFSSRDRSRWIAELRSNPDVPEVYDLVIIGGGIVGAGLARTLALCGKKVLLVEKGDFASGTSSRSTKLIHGGLRYLEMFDFKLVFESLAERSWLLRNHPHLVHPLAFHLPLYEREHAPSVGMRPAWILRLGLFLYDALALGRAPFRHGKKSPEQTLNAFSGLRERGLKGAYYYSDAYMMDDEIVLEAVYQASQHGARLLNYVKAEKIEPRNEQNLFSVQLQDQLDMGSRTFHVKAKEVFVGVGPWTEVFGNALAGGAGRRLKPSKGVHVIFSKNRLPVEEALVMFAPDGRIVFAIPRKDFGNQTDVVIVGTTETAYHQDLNQITADAQDVRYLLEVLKIYFGSQGLSSEDVLMTYAGVRPLLDSGESSEVKTSREHEIWRNPAGIVFMAGGKYTTFRKISVEIAEYIFPELKKKRKLSYIPLSSVGEYEERFGKSPGLWGRFTEDWVRWKIDYHMPCSLMDIIFRRMPLWMEGKNLSEELLLRIARIAQPHFEWTEEVLKQQVENVQQEIQLRLRGL